MADIILKPFLQEDDQQQLIKKIEGMKPFLCLLLLEQICYRKLQSHNRKS